ncbi:transcriptional regulator [Spiractinospora alimapuensis]|uniref:transcriptional regulator n=1 Tax=Spiractinospora alimapuensis TaxID=2820884 RepID=UPI001F31B68E|nr:transcriptional regulator [Spiractinospora alimapuensis]QVQ54928.1 transcriptional regulator [Spiractinospora alimapuensis]
MLMGPGSTGPLNARLIAAAYRDEQEATDKVLRLGNSTDAYLFASPVPYEYARKAGVLTMPATYVPLGGASLHEALLRATLDDRFDPAAASVDVLNRSDVVEAYSEVDLPVNGLHVHEELSSASNIISFHEGLWRRKATRMAITCVRGVAERLEAIGIPVIQLRPTSAGVRSALQTASLLGAHQRLEEAQLGVVIVDVPTLRDSARRSTPRYWREELRLALHRLLLQEAHRINATAHPVDDHTFMVTATRGSLVGATEGFRHPPFVERIRSELGVAVEVGIGMGRTTQDAETHARAAVGRAQATRQSFAVDREGRSLVPAQRAPVRRSPDHLKSKGRETLMRLAEKINKEGSSLVVDAETAGRMLDVTPRTARRLLRTLVEEGLAWPLPPNRTLQPGRPRQLYRLIVEKLNRANR